MNQTYRGSFYRLVLGNLLPAFAALYLLARFLVWPPFLTFLEQTDPEVRAHLPPLWVILGIAFAMAVGIARWHTSRRFIRLEPDGLLYRDDGGHIRIPYKAIAFLRRGAFVPRGAGKPVPYYRMGAANREIAFGRVGVFANRDYFTEDQVRVLILDIARSESLREEIIRRAGLEARANDWWIKRKRQTFTAAATPPESETREYPARPVHMVLGLALAAATLLAGAGILGMYFPFRYPPADPDGGLTFGYSVTGFLRCYQWAFAMPFFSLLASFLMQTLVRKKPLFVILAVSHLVLCLLFHIAPILGTALGPDHSRNTVVRLDPEGIAWHEWIGGDRQEPVTIAWHEVERLEIHPTSRSLASRAVYSHPSKGETACRGPWRGYQGYSRYSFLCGGSKSITLLNSLQDFDRLTGEIVRRAGLEEEPG
jgi:hypothetical protein